MKNIILIILFWGVSQIQAQTKKEQIQILSLKIDSLIHIVNTERDLNAIEKNKYEDKFKIYFKEIESLNKSIKDLNDYIDKYKFKLDSVNSAFNLEINSKEKQILKLLTQYPDLIKSSADNLNPSLIANYTYELVKAFNSYYQTTTILKIENNDVKLFRLSLSYKVGLIIKSSMKLLGISVPDKM